MYTFQSVSSKFPTIFLNLIFHFSLPRLGHFCRNKKTYNFRIHKCDGERNEKKSSLS